MPVIATFIAAAPTDVARLIGVVEAVLGLAEKWEAHFPYKADQVRAAVENALETKEAQ